MSGDPVVFLPRDAMDKIAQAAAAAGDLMMTKVSGDDFYVVSQVEPSKGLRLQVDVPKQYSALRWDGSRHAGQWLRDPRPELTAAHLYAGRRFDVGLPWTTFKQLVPQVEDPGNGLGLLIVHNPELPDTLRSLGAAEFAAWTITRDGAHPLHIAAEPQTVGIAQLDGPWPVAQLASKTIMIVGCGSIGSVAAESLAKYGVGNIDLIDPDRYLWHNMIRHVLGPEHVGRLKVTALKQHLTERWPHQTVAAHPLDVVEQAHQVRPLLAKADLVLCAADGIAPRRVVSHLARQARKPAVLACVLHQGAIGEVLRLRPTPKFGCLLCHRAHLAELGAIDAEADQELDYGTGFVHQPMTAVPTDLHLIGTLAAKVAVATLLEASHGDATQHLPGEHAVIGLRPTSDLAPPFDIKDAGDIRWETVPPPRSECSTCRLT